MCTLPVPSHWGKPFSGNESGVLPLSVPPMPAPARLTFSHSQDKEVWWGPNTNDVGNVTPGQGFHISKCYPSVVHTISKDFASGSVFIFEQTPTAGVTPHLLLPNTWLWSHSLNCQSSTKIFFSFIHGYAQERAMVGSAHPLLPCTTHVGSNLYDVLTSFPGNRQAAAPRPTLPLRWAQPARCARPPNDLGWKSLILESGY